MAEKQAPTPTPASDLSRGDAPTSPLQGLGASDKTVPGGHYIVNGVHVDANGKEIADPIAPTDTDKDTK